MVRKIIVALILFASSILIFVGYGVESIDLQNSIEMPPLDSKYSNLFRFIENYNCVAQTPIQNIIEIDISRGSEYYRTEYRLNAFQNAPALKADIGFGTIEMINSNYEGIFGSNVRVYAFTNSLETAIDVFESFCKATNPEITEADFQEFYEFHQLDSGDCRIVIGNISGYVMVKDEGFDIMLEGSPDYFDLE